MTEDFVKFTSFLKINVHPNQMLSNRNKVLLSRKTLLTTDRSCKKPRHPPLTHLLTLPWRNNHREGKRGKQGRVIGRRPGSLYYFNWCSISLCVPHSLFFIFSYLWDLSLYPQITNICKTLAWNGVLLCDCIWGDMLMQWGPPLPVHTQIHTHQHSESSCGWLHRR